MINFSFKANKPKLDKEVYLGNDSANWIVFYRKGNPINEEYWDTAANYYVKTKTAKVL
jgi:hypothetical protein